MICMEVAGLKKVLFKVVFPIGLFALWAMICYPICNKAEGFDYFLYWILVGCPYGMRKMCLFLVPKNFGIAGSIGVIAFNFVIGGLIGGIVAAWRMVQAVVEVIKIITGHFWTSCPKVEKFSHR